MTNVFDVTHDSGGALTTHYDTVTDAGSNASITGVAALDGSSNGVSLQIDDANSVFLRKNFTNPSTNELRLRFHFDPNNITIPGSGKADASSFIIRVRIRDGAGGSDNVTVDIYWNNGAFNIRATNRWGTDGDPTVTTFFEDNSLSDAPHCIEIRIVRASGAAANDGELQVFLDGVSQASSNGEDNYDSFPNLVNVDISTDSGANADGVSGTVYFDELEMDDDDTVNLCAGASPSVSHLWHFNGTSWVRIDDSGWAASPIRALEVIPGTDFDELYAVAGGNDVQQTLNGGTSWASRGTLTNNPVSSEIVDGGAAGLDLIAHHEAPAAVKVERMTNLQSGTPAVSDLTGNHSTNGDGSDVVGVA